MTPIRATTERVSRRRRPRRGMAVMMLVFALVVMAGMLAVAWNRSHVATLYQQQQVACEAAALAGAAELMDEHVLYGLADLQDDIVQARVAAQNFGAKNVADGIPVSLDLNLLNDPRGDVVVGCVARPDLVGWPLDPTSATSSVNTVYVQAARNKRHGNPVGMWLGSLFGVGTANVVSAAQATVDHCVIGFRPRFEGTTPVVPLVMDAQAWSRQTSPGAAAAEGAQDNYIVNYRTGAVSPGCDSILEIELRATLGMAAESGANNASSQLVALLLSSSPSTTDRQRQMLVGLNRQDLQNFGGELSLGSGGSLLVPVLPYLDETWVNSLNAIVGLPRVWPLGVPAGQNGSDASYDLLGFGAAVVVSACIESQGPSSELVVLVQPALVATGTALIDPQAGANPYIAKLMLTQ